MAKINLGFAMCGSFCTFSKAINQLEKLVSDDYNIIPIMSDNAYNTDTRFGKAKDFVDKMETLTGKKVLHTVCDTEPLGPKKMCDLLVVAPCTGNTLAKLCNGITDTSVTMAIKSHLRIQRPVLICLATSDGLGAAAQNIGRLLNTKNIYFVPLSQDDYVNKPNSLVAHFDLIPKSVEQVLKGKQPQPIFS